MQSDIKKQRCADFRGFVASRRIQIKEVAREAGINVDSLYVCLRTYNLSNERLDLIEQTAHNIADRRSQSNPNPLH